MPDQCRRRSGKANPTAAWKSRRACKRRHPKPCGDDGCSLQQGAQLSHFRYSLKDQECDMRTVKAVSLTDRFLKRYLSRDADEAWCRRRRRYRVGVATPRCAAPHPNARSSRNRLGLAPGRSSGGALGAVVGLPGQQSQPVRLRRPPGAPRLFGPIGQARGGALRIAQGAAGDGGEGLHVHVVIPYRVTWKVTETFDMESAAPPVNGAVWAGQLADS